MPDVTVVTVTYKARWHLLRRALASARSEGAHAAVVVDNGSDQDIARLATAEFGEFVHVVRHKKNLGSAAGFKKGIEEALQKDTEFILLLDDDNELQRGCLDALRRSHESQRLRTPPADLVLLAHRPDHQSDVAARFGAAGRVARHDGFFGFSVLDLPKKLSRWRGRPESQGPSVPSTDIYVLETAPYSGMYFHRAAVLQHGLPDEQFVLYADDTEFSYRLTADNGKIVLVTDARIVDLEVSWNVKRQFASAIDSWLLGGSDLQVFFAARNHAYWERHCRPGHGLRRSINKAVYLGLLCARAVQVRRFARYRLLLNAIRDGEARRLGESILFPLWNSQDDV